MSNEDTHENILSWFSIPFKRTENLWNIVPDTKFQITVPSVSMLILFADRYSQKTYADAVRKANSKNV